jgi:DNA polymerase
MANDIFDEIIECLKQQQEKTKSVSIDEKVLREFYQDTPPPTVNLNTEPAFNRAMPQTDRFDVQPQTAPKQEPMPLADISNMDLAQLEAYVKECRRCRLCERRHNVVFGEGNPSADLMFIGEGPGFDEDQQGRPFVGKAGELLTKMINAMQFSREEVFIANIVKCRPPGNRNPQPDEAEACLPYLQRQIELIQPKAIVVLGAVPLKFLLNKSGIMRMRGHWDSYNGIQVMPTFHPAYLLRSPDAKRDTWNDLQQVMGLFGKVHNKS